jgi:primosomal protein N'
MRIKEITNQNRRDFTALMECEHCGSTEINGSGYDDAFYHKNVIPKIECKQCGKTSGEDYKPRETKYAAHEVV